MSKTVRAQAAVKTGLHFMAAVWAARRGSAPPCYIWGL